MDVNTKYASRKSGKVGTVVEINEKYKTVILEFEDGKTQNCTWTNLRKSYKRVEEDVLAQEAAEVAESEQAEDVVNEVNELVKEEVKEDSTALVPVEEKKQKKEKKTVKKDSAEKKERKPREKFDYMTVAKPILDVVAKYPFDCYNYNDSPAFYVLKHSGRVRAEIYFGRKGFKMNTKVGISEDIGVGEHKTLNNYYLPSCVNHIPYERTDVVNTILSRVMETTNSENQKTKKEDK